MAEETPQWVAQQKKAFSRWVDNRLSEENLSLPADQDISVAFHDGLLLIPLAEILCKEKSALKHQKTPKMRVHQVENCNIALKLLETHGFHSDCSNEMLVDGNQKMVLGFIYQLFVKFQGGESAGGKDNLMEWVKARTTPKNVDVHNWTNSWQDGTAVAAILDSMDKHLMDFDTLNKDDKEGNLNKAFDVALNKLGVPKLLDAHDLISFEPDDKSVKMYVTLLKNAWEQKGAEIAAKIAADEAAAEEKRRIRENTPKEEIWRMLDELQGKYDDLEKKPCPKCGFCGNPTAEHAAA